VNALTRTFLAVLVVAVLFAMYNQDLQTTLLYSLVLGVVISLPDLIDLVKAPYIQYPSEPFVARVTPFDQPAPPAPAVPRSEQTDDGPDVTMPMPRNPFMNVLVDEIKYNPNRPEAAPVDNPIVKKTLDDYFRVQWFSDPTDVFGKSQSQRQFITMPATTIPNDRESYQNWLYKIPGKTCKEGGREACVDGTAGAALPWLNINP
jgi:hypothetical protein